MIYNVSMRKQMSIDGNGVISDGTEKSYVSFNYPDYGIVADGCAGVHSMDRKSRWNPQHHDFQPKWVEQTKTFHVTRPDSSTVLDAS